MSELENFIKLALKKPKFSKEKENWKLSLSPLSCLIVFRRANIDIHIEEGRDVWWHREMEYVTADCPAEPLDSEHPLFILYTSGSTGKPEVIPLHDAYLGDRVGALPSLKLTLPTRVPGIRRRDRIPG